MSNKVNTTKDVLGVVIYAVTLMAITYGIAYYGGKGWKKGTKDE